MPRATPYMPFVQFLMDENEDCHDDDDFKDLMDGIADTLGDMFGYQLDRYGAVERFVERLQAAADAAAQTRSMSKN